MTRPGIEHQDQSAKRADGARDVFDHDDARAIVEAGAQQGDVRAPSDLVRLDGALFAHADALADFDHKRIELAQALACSPDLLSLDEWLAVHSSWRACPAPSTRATMYGRRRLNVAVARAGAERLLAPCGRRCRRGTCFQACEWMNGCAAAIPHLCVADRRLLTMSRSSPQPLGPISPTLWP
jgi:hypothetical protein